MMRDNLIPILFFLFMIINIYLDKTKRKKRRAERRRQEQEQPTQMQQQPAAGGQPDLAAEFERRLKKTTEEAETQKRQQQDRVVSDRQYIHRDDEKVVHDSAGRVHRDDEALSHDSRGRIHRDDEVLAHDKGRVYRDPRSDYSYSEEQMNAAAAAFNAYYAKEQEPELRPRVQLRHKALVNGFIMSQVLDKPRALKPYEECK